MLPDSACFWIVVAYAGAAIGDRCFVDWAPKPIFPNFPLMVVMPSGWGKTGAMNTARPLFDNCLPYRIPEDCTAESAVRAFAQNARSRFSNSVCIWEIPELADVFGRKDYQQGLIARVTRLLDAPKDREAFRVTGNVQFRIQGHAVMTWVAGTTMEWLSQHVEDAVSSGGFLPRLINLYEEANPKWIPNPQRDETQIRTLNSELYQLLNADTSPVSIAVPLPDWWEEVSQKTYEDLVASKDTLATPFIARRQENILRIWLIFTKLGSVSKWNTVGEMTQSFDIRSTCLNCAQWLENQSVKLSEDLIVRQNPLFERVLGIVERRQNGVKFSEIIRLVRGMTAFQLSNVLRDLVDRGLIKWNGLKGDHGIAKPVIRDKQEEE